MTALAQKLLGKQNAPAVPPAVAASVEPEMLSITAAARRTGISRDTLYRLYKAGFVKGWMPGPKKILLYAQDLRDFCMSVLQPRFWTSERKARYNGKAVG